MKLSLEEQKKIIQAGRYDLIDFSIITDQRYKPSWHHEKIGKGLEMIESGEISRLIIEMPPRHGKSQLASINFPAWYLGRNPSNEIIAASYSSDLSQDFGAKTRNLINSDIYQEIFNIRLRQDEQAKSKWRTTDGGTYVSTGVGGSITGRGAGVLIIDDPFKNREEADSKVIRDKVWNWYISTAYTRLSKNGAVIVIATRWHLDDLIGRILKAQSDGGEKWDIISFPAIAENDEEFRKRGEALWPEMYDLDKLETIKKTVGPYEWQSLYQQKPVLTEGQEFKEYWIKSRSWNEVDHLETRKFATIDPGGKEIENDYTGIIRNYVDRQNKWSIKAMRVHFDSRELVDYIFKLHEEGFEKIGIEETVYLKAIDPFLKEECRKRDAFPNIIPVKHHNTQKEVRIRGLIPRYSSGAIYHIENECSDLEEEMLVFPKGAYDDTIDAMAMQNEIAEPPHLIGQRQSEIFQRNRNLPKSTR